MHPFSLNDDEIKQVSGAGHVTIKTGEDGGPYTTLALGEEGGLPPADQTLKGGVYTTLALGEEGGLPPAI